MASYLLLIAHYGQEDPVFDRLDKSSKVGRVSQVNGPYTFVVETVFMFQEDLNKFADEIRTWPEVENVTPLGENREARRKATTRQTGPGSFPSGSGDAH